MVFGLCVCVFCVAFVGAFFFALRTARVCLEKGACHIWWTREESTLSVVVSMSLNAALWREFLEERGMDGAFVLEIPFGGRYINFYLKGDAEGPILRGNLGGCVWRKGCKWYVEQRGAAPVLELFMPKQTPEPWSYVVEGYERLSRVAYDPFQQMILDGLWDDEAIEDKANGDAHFREGEYRAAVKCYSRALERNPDSYVTLTNRAAARLGPSAHISQFLRVVSILVGHSVSVLLHECCSLLLCHSMFTSLGLSHSSFPTLTPAPRID